MQLVYSTRTLHSGCKDLDNQAMSGRSETMDSKAILQAMEANSQRIRWAWHLQSSIVCHLHDLGKKHPELLLNCHVTKILQNLTYPHKNLFQINVFSDKKKIKVPLCNIIFLIDLFNITFLWLLQNLWNLKKFTKRTFRLQKLEFKKCYSLVTNQPKIKCRKTYQFLPAI